MTGSELFPIVTDAAKPVGSAVGGTLADVWQGLIGDRVTAWRIRNAAGVNEKLGIELAKTGHTLNLDKIPEGVAFAWFQKATETDEPEIQELFAKLLANAASGNAEALKKRNIDLISRLTPSEAKMIKVIDERYKQTGGRWATGRGWNALEVSFLEATNPRSTRAGEEPIDSLVALGILRRDNDVWIDEGEASDLIRQLASEEDLAQITTEFASLIRYEFAIVLTTVGASLVEALFPPAQ